jgi:CubicO group peptidase (beta-lactamase class C family)
LPEPAPIDGLCDPRFHAVREAFARNFADRDERGAAVCIAVSGRRVVDLWGGWRVPDEPWQRDTLVNAYSVGKGILAVLTLALVEDGVLDLGDPIEACWPEFAVEGKDRIDLTTLLTHRAGLPSVRERLPDGAELEWERMCNALAGQAPWWEPGTKHGYHVNTFGYLIGEVIRRKTGTRVGDALRERVTGPLAVEFRWGVPPSAHPRIAPVLGIQPSRKVSPEDWPLAFPPTGDAEHDRMIWHAYFNPSGLSGTGVVNSEGWRRAEIPSTNGHGTARALAAIFEALAPRAGRTPLVGPELIAEASRVHVAGEDAVLGKPSFFGLGFQLAHPGRPLGPNPGAFGHYGYGGSLGFADPQADVAFGYVTSRPGERWQTPRPQALIDALYDCLGKA